MVRRCIWCLKKRLCATTLLLWIVSGCASTAPQPESLYEELGGQEGIRRIVNEFLIEIAGNQEIRQHFVNLDIAGFRGRLEDFFCTVADGQCEYTGRSMRESHATLGIERKDFNSIVENLIDAMDRVGIRYATQNAFLSRLAVLEADIVTDARFARPGSDRNHEQLQRVFHSN